MTKFQPSGVVKIKQAAVAVEAGWSRGCITNGIQIGIL